MRRRDACHALKHVDVLRVRAQQAALLEQLEEECVFVGGSCRVERRARSKNGSGCWQSTRDRSRTLAWAGGTLRAWSRARAGRAKVRDAGFTRFNARHPHDVGDQPSLTVADALHGHVRQGQRLAYRFFKERTTGLCRSTGGTPCPARGRTGALGNAGARPRSPLRAESSAGVGSTVSASTKPLWHPIPRRF